MFAYNFHNNSSRPSVEFSVRKVLLNPFLMYAIIMAVVLLIYAEKWVGFYLPLHYSTYALIIICSIFCLFFAFIWRKLGYDDYRVINSGRQHLKTSFRVFIVGVGFLTLELLSQGVPLLGSIDYTSFGYPVVHVVALSMMNSGVILILVSKGLKSIQARFSLALAIAMSLLIVNRFQVLLMVLLVLYYKISHSRVSATTLILYAFLGLLVLILFGEIGVVRMSYILDIDYSQARKYILEAGDATEAYKQMDLPVSFFWVYIYVTSPLANLNLNVVSHFGVQEFSKLPELLLNEILPMTFSKRINEALSLEPFTQTLLVEHFNVSTALVGPNNYMGLSGAIIYLCVTFMLLLLMKTVVKNDGEISLSVSLHLSLFFPFLIFYNVVVLPVFFFGLMIFLAIKLKK